MVQFLAVDEAEQERHGEGRRRSPPPLVRIASRAFLVAVGVAWYDNFVLEFIIPYLVVLDYLIIATSQFTFL